MTGYWTETPKKLYGESREEFIKERIAVRKHMGGQDEDGAIIGAHRDWANWCRDRKLDVETGMPLGEQNG